MPYAVADRHRLSPEALTFIAERIELPRGRREAAIAVYAQRYADRLAVLCQRAPFQWFNFFDFWAGADSARARQFP